MATLQVTRPAPRTRVELLPKLVKGIKLPAGYTPAYYRRRQHLAVLRADNSSHYLIFDVTSGKSRQTPTTHSAALLMSAVSHGTARLHK
jgi:hypothetical protein